MKDRRFRTGIGALCALLAGCASGGGAAPEPSPAAAPGADSTVADSAVAVPDAACRMSSTVTVHVRNQGSADIQISFGGYTPARASAGFSRSTYTVARTHLQNTVIRLRILRGGLQQGGPAEIPTEHVVCNDATLIIGAQPRYSFFYGGIVRGPERN